MFGKYSVNRYLILRLEVNPKGEIVEEKQWVSTPHFLEMAM